MEPPTPTSGTRRLARLAGLALAALVLWQGALGVWRAQRWEFAGWRASLEWSPEQRLNAALRQGKRTDVYAAEVLRLRQRILEASAETTPLVSRPLPAPAGRGIYDQLAILIYPRPTAYWESGADPSAAEHGHALYLAPRDAPHEPWMDAAHELERGQHFTLWERGARR